MGRQCLHVLNTFALVLRFPQFANVLLTSRVCLVSPSKMIESLCEAPAYSGCALERNPAIRGTPKVVNGLRHCAGSSCHVFPVPRSSIHGPEAITQGVLFRSWCMLLCGLQTHIHRRVVHV